MESSKQKPHAVMFPMPYQGHLTPCIQLAIKLASKGFTITFVNTQIIHHQLTKSQPNSTSANATEDDVFAKARESGLDIRYKTMTDCLPLDSDRKLNEALLMELNFLGFPAHVDELVGNLVKSDPPVSCLITDTFYTWASRMAKKYKLVHVSFWPMEALAFNLYYHLDLLKTNGHFPVKDNKDTITYIPGVKAIEPKDLPSYIQGPEQGTRRHFDEAFQETKNADFILCNTIQELESDTILAIQEIKPLYAIGPLNYPQGFTKRIVPTSLKAEFDCSQWLSTKPKGSVLYVSFGSFITFEKSDIDEVAYGLVLSGVNFIWALRPNSVSNDEPYELPVALQDKIKEKGLVVTWTNQIEVISNPAIGGLLSHCGWNSVMESLWCGLPMLCYPHSGDQKPSRKLVVDDWKIGLDLCDQKLLARSEVAEKITRLMSGKSANELRKKANEISQIVRNASVTNGSSEKNLSKFIADVKAKIGEQT